MAPTTPILAALLLCRLTSAFIPSPPSTHIAPPSPLYQRLQSLPSSTSRTSAKKDKKKSGGASLPKLKAKSQWDRYADLKSCEKIQVGVRIKGTEEWMQVGRVRSENDAFSEVAVARQRALIAEHAKRLYPVQLPANSVIEWGYLTPSNDDDSEGKWTIVDKSVGDDAPSGVEKKIGFEGISDKATGFYCYYHEGRIVEREDEGKGKRTSVV
ncbi:predicted protein [Thalassiosira pseudonana CCMP1335]|uniref:Uncharacterized protein n=1 Tax=Thalassiosira pseudonana TaxID=35128 RepID=B8C9S2_THAPS|nr:predicted protein [Thalassiosira pseudonana CCMP1335]EED90093.1 predicted protein [Thalassiosira pseudonana CCMP1335]